MTVYAPGTAETDPKKQNRALQAAGAAIATNTTDIATANTNIATNTSAISALQAGPLVSGAVAAKSDEVAGTSTTLATTPGRQQFHPSAAKAWVAFNSSGTILGSYNVASVTRTATGKFTIAFTVAFANTNYQCNVTSECNGNATSAVISVVDSTSAPKTTSAVSLFFLNAGATAFANPDVGHLACFGTQ